jgi:hypothetical protein
MAERRGTLLASFGLGEGIVTAGAIAVIVSIFLTWEDAVTIAGHQVTQQVKANGVPVQFLWNWTIRSGDPSLLVILIPVVALLVLGVVSLHARWLTLAGGALAVAVGLTYIFQLHQTVRAARALVPGHGLSDFLGIAPIICVAGGVIALIGGLVLAVRGSAST